MVSWYVCEAMGVGDQLHVCMLLMHTCVQIQARCTCLLARLPPPKSGPGTVSSTFLINSSTSLYPSSCPSCSATDMLQVPERRQKNFVEEVWGTAVGTVGTVGRTVGDVGNAMGRTVGDVGNATGGFLTKVTKVVPNLIPNGGADRQYDRLRSEVTGEAEGVVPSVSPMVMWKRLGCYLVVLVIGMVLGGVAVREEWIDLTAYDPALSAMDGWLTSPIADTTGNLYCDDGLFVPGPIRNGANTILFLSLLLWAFLGVAIAADVFMAGIEKITSEETTIERDGVVYTINVWNATIANLTLMALGSSAPEILLSVIEIVGGSFYAGELGPSTIVGSAAFNMLVISAVCVTAIPDGGGRRIKVRHHSSTQAHADILTLAYLIPPYLTGASRSSMSSM